MNLWEPWVCCCRRAFASTGEHCNLELDVHMHTVRSRHTSNPGSLAREADDRARGGYAELRCGSLGPCERGLLPRTNTCKADSTAAFGVKKGLESRCDSPVSEICWTFTKRLFVEGPGLGQHGQVASGSVHP